MSSFAVPLQTLLRSLQTKLLATTVPLVLLSTAALFILIQKNAERTALADLQAKLEEVLTIQSTSVSGPLWQLDLKQVALMLEAMTTDPDVLGAIVYDETEQIIAQVGAMEAEDQTIYVRTEPIRFGDTSDLQNIGQLKVAFTDQRVRAATRERQIAAAAFAGLLIVAIVISVVLGHRRTVGTPLNRLLGAIHTA